MGTVIVGGGGGGDRELEAAEGVEQGLQAVCRVAGVGAQAEGRCVEGQGVELAGQGEDAGQGGAGGGPDEAEGLEVGGAAQDVEVEVVREGALRLVVGRVVQGELDG